MSERCRALVPDGDGRRRCRQGVGSVLAEKELGICGTHAAQLSATPVEIIDGPPLEVRRMPCLALRVTTNDPCENPARPGKRFCGIHEYSGNGWRGQIRAAEVRKREAYEALISDRESLLARVADVVRRSGVEDAERLCTALERALLPKPRNPASPL
jgi:hypothetical protein